MIALTFEAWDRFFQDWLGREAEGRAEVGLDKRPERQARRPSERHEGAADIAVRAGFAHQHDRRLARLTLRLVCLSPRS